ncbi:hypothetical protein HBE96_21965 [Clostridium sp. P21]|uniref:Uncharacterized protein n=1 Tax=Clostridium muellerianum TaxID=2716538 RepID=A0A7Y0EKP7_9CLOT|nr:hypothetical protein [Clostridium muellerianum]NMM65254.1 hypothetical protein [Clostridium muellerianum]
MIELAYLTDMNKVKALTDEVQNIIEGILHVLDSEYGTSRDKYEDDGGYVVVIEKEEDFQIIKDKIYIDCDSIIPEYVDKIVCSNDKTYTNSLILCNNEYAISLIIPMELLPQNLKDYIID